MKYLKIWTSFYDLIGQLQYDEIGRLFEAMLIYAESGKEPESFEGNERFLWPVAKQQIDFAAEKNEILRQNGMKGGRPKTKQNQTKPNETKENQSEAEKKRKEKKYKEKDLFIEDDNARAIAAEQSQVLDAADDAGFKMSNDVRDSLIALYAENGLQKMLDGMRSCVEHGAPNLAYLKACLRDEPRKRTASKMLKAVNAQLYEQRDYSGEQDDAMNRMISQMEASV